MFTPKKIEERKIIGDKLLQIKKDEFKVLTDTIRKEFKKLQYDTLLKQLKPHKILLEIAYPDLIFVCNEKGEKIFYYNTKDEWCWIKYKSQNINIIDWKSIICKELHFLNLQSHQITYGIEN